MTTQLKPLIHIPTEGEHSELGASAAHRWRKCAASIPRSRGYPDTAGYEADLGTLFHEVAAMCFDLGLDPSGFIGFKMTFPQSGVIEFTQKMADDMRPGLALLNGFVASESVVLVETRVSLEPWTLPDQFSTTDAIVANPVLRRIVVFDWKYGAGVPVSPVENDQGFLYVLGAWSTYLEPLFREALEPWEDESDIEVWVVIEQPRAPGGGGVWKTNMGAMLAEGEKIRVEAARTQDPNAAAIPGLEQCKFCPCAKMKSCPEHITFMTDLFTDDFDLDDTRHPVEGALTIKPKSVFTPESRSLLLLHKPMIESLLSSLWTDAQNDAEMGRPVPGMKRIAGRRGARKWKDDDLAELVLTTKLRDAAWGKSLLSPAQVEERVGKATYKAFEEMGLVQFGEAKPILVPESDPHEALPDITADFDDDDVFNPLI